MIGPQKLGVHQIGAEWEDRECNETQVDASLVDRHELGSTMKRQYQRVRFTAGLTQPMQ